MAEGCRGGCVVAPMGRGARASRSVIMVSEAYLISHDVEWAASHADAIGPVLAFYELYADEVGLVHEIPFGNWEDSLLFEGARAFTNLLYLEALRRARDLFRVVGRTAEADKYEHTHQRLYEPVMDLVCTQRDTVSVALAALWLPDEERVDQCMHEMLAVYPETMPPNRWPIPPPEECCKTIRVLGHDGYHRTFRWSNVGCLWAAALLHRGFRSEGEKVLARFDRAVERYGSLHEVFEPEDETPVNCAIYRSETRFSMGLGPYLLAHEKLRDADPDRDIRVDRRVSPDDEQVQQLKQSSDVDSNETVGLFSVLESKGQSSKRICVICGVAVSVVSLMLLLTTYNARLHREFLHWLQALVLPGHSTLWSSLVLTAVLTICTVLAVIPISLVELLCGYFLRD
eukprot:6648102-Prymnesium_polylepis.1